MKTYISILRGINVSGQKMIKMDALRKMYESIGFHNVKTYIQSGNVIFQDSNLNFQELEGKIEAGILKEFGFEVPVMVLDGGELEILRTQNPFLNEGNPDLDKLHVTVLSGSPDPSNLSKIKDGNYSPDEFIVLGRYVYLHCPDGYGRTKLNNNFFESKLKMRATTRNWKTVNELCALVKN